MELKFERPSRKYEAVIIMHPDATEQQQKDFFKKNSEILKSFKGDYSQVDSWGKRRLANPIGKLRMGHFFHAFFEAHSESIAELERTMRINDQVLRFNHMRLDDRVSIAQHLEDYREVLVGSSKREQEREAKAQARKMARTRN